MSRSQGSESRVCYLVSGLKAMDKPYPESRQHRRDESVHEDTTAAQHSSPLVEQLLAFCLVWDSMLHLCGGLAHPSGGTS